MKGNPTKLSSTLHICCININHSTLTHNIVTLKQTFDIILVQEPWWNGRLTTSFQGWQVILPTPIIKGNEHPRVVAYYQLQAGIDVTLRTDIRADLDFMILDIKHAGSRHPCTCLINIYNQIEPR